MLADLLEAAIGLLLSPLVFVLPGYALGRATGVFNFCSRTFVVQLAIAMMLSVAVGPVLIHLLLRFGWIPVWLTYGLSWVAAIVYFARARPSIVGLRKPLLLSLCIAAMLVLLIVDIGWGDKLYFSVVARDYLKHFALTEVIRAGGLPPTNPFFFDGEAIPLFYYYGWLLMTSALDALGGGLVGPRGAVIAGSAATGAALVATAAVLSHTLKNPLVGDRGDSGKCARPFIAVALLFVGGLDILVFLAGMAGQAVLGMPIVFTDIEWWNEPLFLWLTSLMTVPHHVAGLISALVGLRVARWAVDPVGGRRSFGVVIAGLAFASSALCSIWVAMGAAVIACMWVLLNVVRKQWKEVLVWISAGLVALIVATPYLLELSSTGSTDGSPLQFGIRAFGPFDRYLGIGRTGLDGLAHLVVLPLGYAIELGFLAFAGWMFWRARKRIEAPLSQDERLLRVMLAVGLIFPTFFYAAVRMNDLGFRVPMFAQLVLLLWAAYLLDAYQSGAIDLPKRRVKQLLLALAVVGVASNVANGLLLRFVPPAADAGLIAMPGMYAPDRQLGERTFAQHEAYEWLQLQTPEDAIVQHNPKPAIERTDGGLAFQPALYARRPFAAYDDDMSTLFSVSPERYFPIAEDIVTAFVNPTEENAEAVAERYDLAALVVTDRDPVWADRNSWVWQRSPDFGNAYVRVFLSSSQ